MKILVAPLLICSFFLLTEAKIWNEEDLRKHTQNHTGDGRTYNYFVSHVDSYGKRENVHMSYTDNSIKRSNFTVSGDMRIFIGNNNVTEEVFPPRSELRDSVQDYQTNFTSNAAYRNSAGAPNASIGNKESQKDPYSSESRGASDGRDSNIQDVPTSFPGPSIRRDSANFEGARNIFVGPNNAVFSFSQTHHTYANKGCSYVDGIIYENGERRQATPAEIEKTRKWAKEMSKWGRRFDKYMRDKMSHIFDKAYYAGPEPKTPLPPCLCSPRHCETASGNFSNN